MARQKRLYACGVSGISDMAIVYIEGTKIGSSMDSYKHIVIPDTTLTTQRKYQKSILANLEGCKRALLVGTTVSKIVLEKRFSEMDRAHGGLFLLDTGVIVVPTYDAKNPEQVSYRKKDIERWKSLEYSLPSYDMLNVCPDLTECGTIYLDIETTGLDFREEGARITSIQLLADSDDTALYIEEPTQELIKQLCEKLFHNSYRVVCHNAMFDLSWLSYFSGLDLFASPYLSIEDTQVLAHNRGCLITNLKHLTSMYTDLNNPEAYQIEKGSFDKTYAVADVFATRALHNRLIKKGYRDIDSLTFRSLRVFGSIKLDGIFVDEDLLKIAYEEALEEQEQLASELHKFAEINWSSPAQVKPALHNLGIKVENTAVDTLKEHSENEVIALLLKYREVSQMVKLFYQKYTPMIEESPSVYPSFRVDGTETGRTSCSSPNLQQANKAMKKMFTSRFENGSIYSFDLDRNELCCAVYLSGDKTMAQALIQYDYHTYVASVAFGVPYEEVTKEQRRIAKMVTFGAIMYGGSPQGIARRTSSDASIIAKAVKSVRNSFKNLTRYQDNQVSFAKRTENLVDCYGKIRNLRLVKYYGYGDGSGNIKRVAMNTPVQALGGYICLELCDFIYQHINDGYLKSKLIGQVHDSVYIDVHPEEEEQIEVICKKAFESLNNTPPLCDLPGWGMVATSGTLTRCKDMSGEDEVEVCQLSSKAFQK